MKVKVSTFLKKYSETRNIHHTCGKEEDEGFTSFHFFSIDFVKGIPSSKVGKSKAHIWNARIVSKVAMTSNNNYFHFFEENSIEEKV